MIAQKDIENILQDYLAKKVFAFKQQLLESYNEYISWAENLLYYSENQQIDEALLELSPFMGNNKEINYYELIDRLTRLCQKLKINPPSKFNATKLFLLGKFEEIILDIQLKETERINILSSSIYEIENIINPCEKRFKQFRIIRHRYVYLDEATPDETLESILDNLYTYIKSYIKKTNIVISLRKGLYNIAINTSMSL